MSQGGSAPRRVQFSSCDECRKSRVACDAGRARRNREDPQELLYCTRCTNRKLQCTFEVGQPILPRLQPPSLHLLISNLTHSG